MKWWDNIPRQWRRLMAGSISDRLPFVLLFVCLLTVYGANGQSGEIEVMGPKRYPFTMMVGDESFRSVQPGRVTATGLPNGHTTVSIWFTDSTITPITDTLTVVSGLRYVYRIVRTREEDGWRRGSARVDPRRLLSRDTIASPFRGDSFRLNLMEVITALEEPTPPSDAESDSTPGLVSHRPDFHFSRQEPIAPADTPTHASDTLTDSVTTFGVPAEPVTGTPSLTAEQLNSLRRELTNLRFEEDRIQKLNATLPGFSLTTRQMYQILVCFDFERNKKAIFQRYFVSLSDKENHQQLYEAFDFQSTVEQLKQWVDGQ